VSQFILLLNLSGGRRFDPCLVAQLVERRTFDSSDKLITYNTNKTMKRILSLLLTLGLILTIHAQTSNSACASIGRRINKIYPKTTVALHESTLLIGTSLEAWCMIQNININNLRDTIEQKNSVIYLSEAFLKDLKKQKINFRRFKFAVVFFEDKDIIYISGRHRLREL